MAADPTIAVEVVYALAGEQRVVALELAGATTVGEAIRRSGLLDLFPEIRLDAGRIGLHGRLVGVDTVLNDGDRVEIYRPLLADPKQARRRRVLPRR